MTVHELSDEQFEELKVAYMVEHDMSDEDVYMPGVLDELVRNYYEGTDFVVDDFGCSAGEYNRHMEFKMCFEEDQISDIERAIGHRVDDDEELYDCVREILDEYCRITKDWEGLK